MFKNKLLSEITWIRKDSLDITGSCLSIELSDVTDETIKTMFGKLPKGTSAKNKYSDSIVIYNDAEGTEAVYTIYTLYGIWRIGANENCKRDNQLAQTIISTEKQLYILN